MPRLEPPSSWSLPTAGVQVETALNETMRRVEQLEAALGAVGKLIVTVEKDLYEQLDQRCDQTPRGLAPGPGSTSGAAHSGQEASGRGAQRLSDSKAASRSGKNPK